MNDLEICKRIAEIEGVEFFHNKDNESLWVKRNGVFSGNEYSPLTDDALCFQLMVKHSVELSPMFTGCWCATIAKVYTFDEQIDHRLCPSWLDDNPNKAICLAIIEVHKED